APLALRFEYVEQWPGDHGRFQRHLVGRFAVALVGRHEGAGRPPERRLCGRGPQSKIGHTRQAGQLDRWKALERNRNGAEQRPEDLRPDLAKRLEKFRLGTPTILWDRGKPDDQAPIEEV